MKIGHILKLIRTTRGNAQKEMAGLLDISQNYLSLIETNRKDPSAEMVDKFAKHLSISKEALLFVSSEAPKELNNKDKRDFQRLQKNILSLVLFELDGISNVKENTSNTDY